MKPVLSPINPVYTLKIGFLVARLYKQISLYFPSVSPLQLYQIKFSYITHLYLPYVKFSHHGMTRPQVADRGTASDMEGSCE